MAKSIIKELIIVLLLALAIILVLGILLYEYVPSTKTIPNEVSYTMPEDAKKELQEAEAIDESQVVMTYEINSSDLNNYRRTQNYKPGKANPFASIETQNGNATTTTGSNNNGTSSTGTTIGNTASQSNSTSGNTGAGTTDNSSQAGTTTDNNTTSGGKFFKDTGTK